jgi:hypothetical protein
MSFRSALPDDFSPLFGAEIEIFVKVKPGTQDAILRARRANPSSLPDCWRTWDFGLENGTGRIEEKDHQRKCVGGAIKAIIERELGPSHGWSCEADASLKEWGLTVPPDTRKWCTYIASLFLSHIVA